MMHTNQPHPRSFSREQRRRSSRRRVAAYREPKAERAMPAEAFDEGGDLPCVRLVQRVHCLLRERPVE